MNDTFPDFYLVGAAKAGTTSLHHYFAQHPGIFVPSVKEPHYFACPEVKDTYYQTEFVDDKEKYLALFDDRKSNQLTGDCSPSYLFSEHAAERIHNERPDAKILIVLRNPIERAISHYFMDHRAGYQPLPLIDCLTNPEAHHQFYREYVEVGRYAEQLQRFFKYFPREQIKIYLFEELQTDTEAVARSIFSFLGVDSEIEIDFSDRKNIAAKHKFKVLDRIVTSAWWTATRKKVPGWGLKMLQSALLDRSIPDFSAEERWLKQFYAEDIDILAGITDLDIQPWRQKTSES